LKESSSEDIQASRAVMSGTEVVNGHLTKEYFNSRNVGVIIHVSLNRSNYFNVKIIGRVIAVIDDV